MEARNPKSEYEQGRFLLEALSVNRPPRSWGALASLAPLGCGWVMTPVSTSVFTRSHPPSLCIHLPFSSLDLLLDLGLILVWGSLITRSFTQVHLQRPWVQVRLCSEVPGGRSFCRAEYSSKHYILWQLLCSFFFESFFNWQTRRSPSLYPSSFSSNNSS